MYAKLRPLHAVLIPKCFGGLGYEGTRALMLSDIGGACLASPEGCLLEAADLWRMLHQALSALAEFEITHDDIKLDNFHLTGDRFMVVDFETVNDGLAEASKLSWVVDCDEDRVVKYYEDHQYCLWDDGEIVVDKMTRSS